MESTSGQERRLAEFLERRFPEIDPKCTCTRYEVGDGTLNLLFRWDNAGMTSRLPKVVLCSHLDTVPPYFAPQFRKINAGETLPDGKITELEEKIGYVFKDKSLISTAVTPRDSSFQCGPPAAVWHQNLRLEKLISDFFFSQVKKQARSALKRSTGTVQVANT